MVCARAPGGQLVDLVGAEQAERDDPRRAPSVGGGHKPRSIANPIDALAAAAGGSLCLHAQRPAPGFQRIVQRWRGSETRVHLVLCSAASDPVLETVADSLVLVPLYLRWRDRIHIISNVATEAAIELGVEGTAVSDADRQIILASDATTLSELETATRRLVAIRHWALGWGGMVRAAEKLGDRARHAEGVGRATGVDHRPS